MADQRFLYLRQKFPQQVVGCAPWPLINELSEDELRADLDISRELREACGENTPEG